MDDAEKSPLTGIAEETNCKATDTKWCKRKLATPLIVSVALVGGLLIGGIGGAELMVWRAAHGAVIESSFTYPPPGLSRVDTVYGVCSCASNSTHVTIWPGSREDQRIVLAPSSAMWLELSAPTWFFSYSCDNETLHRSISPYYIPVKVDHGQRWWSVQLYSAGENKDECPDQEGLQLRFNTWEHSTDLTSVPFTSELDGFACVKVPALLKTHVGTLIAFSEARRGSCSDFAETVLLYRRSTNGGREWSAAKELVDPKTTVNATRLCGLPLVVGNIAPVQLSMHDQHHPGRILAPYMRNNYHSWVIHSDDDGMTWSGDRKMDIDAPLTLVPDCTRNLTYFGFALPRSLEQLGNKMKVEDLIKFIVELGWGTDPYRSQQWRSKLTGPWQFVGFGPPGSIRLNSGRVLVPGYHSYIRGLEVQGSNGSPGQLPLSQLFNNFALGHSVTSDDGGETWKLRHSFKNIGEGANELQMLQMPSGQILVNSRSFSTGSPQFRIQAISNDDGDTFSPTTFTYDLPQPFNGCQGSLVIGEEGEIYFSGPNPEPNTAFANQILKDLRARVNLTGRDHMTVWRSDDEGQTYQPALLVDAGAAGYSSLQYRNDGLDLLYEQADHAPWTPSEFLSQITVGQAVVQVPTRIVYRRIPLTELKGL